VKSTEESPRWQPIDGGVTAPTGFTAAGVRCGLKSSGPDVAILFSDRPAAAAALFTRNLVRAAPVQVSMRRAASGFARAVVANAGNANACTGAQGLRDAEAMAARAAERLGVAAEEVLVASTGVIGRPLPMDRVLSGIDSAAQSLSRSGGADAALAIMTTDTRPKERALQVLLPDGRAVRLGAMAKGVGMICPNLATMLCFITTDAPVGAPTLRTILQSAADVSFNCLTVDGDGSTNDSVFMLANGASGGQPIEADQSTLRAFSDALAELCIDLARQMARDGEGATKLVTVVVTGAADDAQARMAASAIANSNLVKTAMFGNDPNWGRVLAAAGRSGASFRPEDASLRFGPIEVFRNGAPVAFDPKAAHDVLAAPEVEVLLTLGDGPGAARYFTCDLSYEYVRINAEYHT